ELLCPEPLRPRRQRLLPAVLAPRSGGGRQARRAGRGPGATGRSAGKRAGGGAAYRNDPGGVGLPRIFPIFSGRPGACRPPPPARGRNPQLPVVDLREPRRPQATLRRPGSL
ncbi:MAG: hypothetical protein AVDCRST_MAG01-01-3618, partial [uncultured Rubrobacteraceae bacterium]